MNFVLDARDPAAPAALFAYADEAELYKMNADYVAGIKWLAMQFYEYRQAFGSGNPDRGCHRTDDPATVAKMRDSRSACAMSEVRTVVPDVAELIRQLRADAAMNRELPSINHLQRTGEMEERAADLIEKQVELLDAATKIADRTKQDYDDCAAECAALRAALTELVACNNAAAPPALWEKRLADAWTAVRATITKDAP